MRSVRHPRVLVGAALFWIGIVLAVGVFAGHEVTVLRTRHTVAEIAEWRALRDPRDDVAEIYGVADPIGPRRLLVWPWDDRLELFVPPEDPRRTLLFVDRAPDAHLVSARVLWPVGLGGAGLLLLGALFARRSPDS